MGKLIDIRQTIVEETGELVREQKRIFTSQFDEEKGYLFWNRKGHSKVYKEIWLPECFTYADKGRLYDLSKYIYSNTNMLGYRGNGGIKPYTKHQIGNLINLKKRALSDFMKKCEDNHVIAEVKVKLPNYCSIQYYMNPIYFFSSNRIPLNLYLIFKSSLDSYLKDWVKAEFNRMENER